jgi:predicted ferric reductase
MVGIYIHCTIAKLPQLPYIRVIIVLWALDRIARMFRLVWFNYSRHEGWTNATIEALPGEACRVTLHLPRKVNIKPGSHAYLRFAGLNAWESHPFSVGWTENKVAAYTFPNGSAVSLKAIKSSKASEKRSDPESVIRGSHLVTDVSFVIHAQTGITRRLFEKANHRVDGRVNLKSFFEGPYAGHHSLDSYGHVVLFAGSSGITHQIPFIKHLISGYQSQSVATRKITLVWIVRDSEHLEWVRPWMDAILKMDKRRECLMIKLFVTRPKNPREIISPSATVQMSPGRPNVRLLLENEVREQQGAMAVTVCGPGGLADNVREAVRENQEKGVVDFIEESFTW